jgi:integrase
MSAGSRPTQRCALNAVARMMGHDPETFPWHTMTLSVAAALSTRLREGRAPATTNRMIAAVRGVLNVCRKERWLQVPPSDGGYAMSQTEWFEQLVEEMAHSKAVREHRGNLVPEAAIASMFAACAKGRPVDLRNGAIIALGFGSAVRREEIANLDLVDVEADGRVRIRAGKGDKDRTTALAKGPRAAVARWVAFRGTAPGPLLLRMSGSGDGIWQPPSRLSPHAVWEAIREVSAAAGVKFTPHDMRRTAATRMLRAGVSLKVVQRALGHKNITTTQRYIMVDEDEMVAAVQSVDIASGSEA